MKTTTDRSEFCNQNNMICVYNETVGGTILTNIDQFEKSKVEYSEMDESEFSQWGGKRGFMNYLEMHLKNEDRYFRKNPRKISIQNKRYQGFCDDMVLYEILRSVVLGAFTPVLPLDKHQGVKEVVKGIMNTQNVSESVH
jgi:hypothetical protein